jgi:hypothetical protein
MVRSRMAAPASNTDAGGVRQTGGRWTPSDKAKALERLAIARANLAGLERQDAPQIDPSIRAAVEERQLQIEALRQEIDAGRRGRAGRQARQQMEALEGTQRLVIECLGFCSFEEFRTATDRFDSSRVDQQLIAKARDEVSRAERHFFDTAEMSVPVPPSVPLGAKPAPRAPQKPIPAPTKVGAPPRFGANPRQPQPMSPAPGRLHAAVAPRRAS